MTFFTFILTTGGFIIKIGKNNQLKLLIAFPSHQEMATRETHYKVLDHTADLGILVYGTSVKNLFENAGYALMDLMVKAGSIEKAFSRKIRISGDDICDLMVRWLGELLYLLEGEKSLVFSIHMDSISHTRLEATVETVPFDPQSHEILTEIKAVTYHQIEVTNNGHHWEAKVIFDL